MKHIASFIILTCIIINLQNIKNTEDMKHFYDSTEPLRQLPDSINPAMMRELYPPPQNTFMEMDGKWYKRIRFAEGDGIYVYIYGPPREFYAVHAFYCPNGKKQIGYQYFGSVGIGTYKRFDEQGNLLESINEDAKFGKIKREYIIALLEKEGFFCRKTGRISFGKDEILPLDGRFYYKLMDYMQIRFIPAEGNNPPEWIIRIYSNFERDWIETTYRVNGETGEFTKKDEYVPMLD